MRNARFVALAALLVASPALAQSDDPHGGGGGGGHAGGGAPAGMPNPPPPDSTDEDASLPGGSISATILDADDHPMPHTPVAIAVLHNTVAKGESRTLIQREADADGVVRLDGQEKGSGVSYRIVVSKNGATFGSNPFQLPPSRGARVRLHVFPVTRDLNDALVVMQGAIFAEMKDDRVQFQTALQIFNFGRTAWVPDEVYFELPPDFTAFRASDETGDRGIENVDKKGGRLRGTFGPGQYNIEFRWQLPYSGEKDVTFEVGFPPHVADARVMAQASPTMTLDVPGFPAAVPKVDAEGQRVLIAERAMKNRDEAPLRRVRATIGNLPTQGPGRFIAAGLAAVGVLGGLGLAIGQRRPWKGKKELDKLERSQLLAELEVLEKLHQSGEVGPKTYERARRELIDALARTLSKEAR